MILLPVNPATAPGEGDHYNCIRRCPKTVAHGLTVHMSIACAFVDVGSTDSKDMPTLKPT